MLTFFTLPKPFLGYIKVIQTNAIRSLTLLRPKCEIILLGNEEGTAELAAELEVRHMPDIEHSEYGTPLVSSVFSIAQNVASNQLMCYVNSDIILMSDFLPAVQRVRKYSYLVIGRRWDLDVRESIDFSYQNWEEQLRARLAEEGKLHAPHGLDYFVYPRGLYESIPPFALGRTKWDNWLVYQARLQKVPIIDATKAITAVHQNHDYNHHPDGKTGIFKGIEARRNLELLGKAEYSLCVIHATWILTPQKLQRALTVKHLFYQLDVLSVLFPCLRFLSIPKILLITFSWIIRSIGHILKRKSRS